MRGNLEGFKAEEQEEMREYGILPVGKYVAVITASDLVDTEKGGKMLKLTFQIVEGEFSNRLVWTNLNLENANEKAEKIARSELAAICRAVDILHPKDSSDLHDLPMEITLKIEPAKGEYPAKNKIAGYEKTGSPASPKEEKKGTPSWRK